MTAITFVIPAYQREHVSELAFAGIRWTLDELDRDGHQARALVVADDGNIRLGADAGFETLRRPNRPLGQKWNDGVEHAYLAGSDFVVICGSDDWVHPDLIRLWLGLEDPGTRWPVFCTRRSTVVAPDGRQAVALTIGYAGGDGIRMFPRRTLDRVQGRPTLDKRQRSLDGGTALNLKAAGVTAAWVYAADPDPLWVVDFKSPYSLTPYDLFPVCEHDPEPIDDPLGRLADLYPAEVLEHAHRFYDLVPA